MHYVWAVLAVALLAVGCTTLSLPLPGAGVGSGVPQTCGERLTESACRDGQRCRWINDTVRSDGTYATAHCTSEL